MAFSRALSFTPSHFAQAFERPSTRKNSLIPDSVECGGIGDGSRDARQECWADSNRRRRNGCMVESALDGPREIVEFGKNRAGCPADSRAATIRAAGPPSLHEQRARARSANIRKSCRREENAQRSSRRLKLAYDGLHELPELFARHPSLQGDGVEAARRLELCTNLGDGMNQAADF